MRNRNKVIFLFIILINLVIGNITLWAMFNELGGIYFILISLFVSILYAWVFKRVLNLKQKYRVLKILFISVASCLAAMLIATIFLTTGIRTTDDIVSSALKGIIFFPIGVIILYPLLLLFATANFICFLGAKAKKELT